MFREKGYELIRDFFEPNELLNESNKIINFAQKVRWKYVKIYHNIYIKNFLNIFCISFPFNKILNSQLLEKLEKINYKSKLLSVTNFKDIESSIVELQHNHKFNYQSTWHRDWNGISSGNVVVILFLTSEKGLRIVPKNIEEKLNIFINESHKNYKTGYKNIPEKFYDVIDAKAGDIIVFDAGLLHQGFSKNKRTHLLVRHKELNLKDKNNNDFFSIYNFKNYLRPNATITELEKISKEDSYDFENDYYSLKKKVKSLINLFLYFFPVVKLVRYLFDIQKKKTHFHYSLFQ